MEQYTRYGWAVHDTEAGILVKTVSDTRRAAIVNWLCTKGGLLPTMSTPDDLIENEWRARRGSAEVMQVTISRTR